MKTKKIVRAALIAAVYTVLCIALAPISYNALQVRVSEALTLLPVLGPWSIVGVTLGCMLSNLVGAFIGANILGFVDVLFGTLAALLAALCTYWLRRVRVKGLPLLACVPPVLFNAVIIGAELTLVMAGGWNWQIFAVQALWTALGEALAVFVLGLPMIKVIEKNPALKAFFNDKE